MTDWITPFIVLIGIVDKGNTLGIDSSNSILENVSKFLGINGPIITSEFLTKLLDDISFNTPTNVIQNAWSNKDLSNIKRQEEFTISEEVLRQQKVSEQKEAERISLLVKKQQEKEQNRLVAYFGPEDDYFSDEEEIEIY